MAGQLKDMKPYVFWDIEDFPPPQGRDVVSFKLEIYHAFRKMGIHFSVGSRMWVYGKKIPEELVRDLVSEAIIYVGIDDKFWRCTKMLMDISQLAFLDLFPYRVTSTFMIIAKRNSDDTNSEFYNIIKEMSTLSYNTVLVLPRACESESVPVPWTRGAWFWEEIVDDGTYVPHDLLMQLREPRVVASSVSPPRLF